MPDTLRIVAAGAWALAVSTGVARGQSSTDDGARVAQLVRQLKSAEYPGDRLVAAGSLGDLGSRAKAAVPALVETLDPNNEIALRDQCVRALGAIAPDDERVVRLIAGLLAERSEIAATARKTLERIGAPAIPALAEKLESRFDDDGEDVYGTYSWAAMALGNIGRPALTAVLSALEDPSRRLGAAEAVRWLGSELAAETVPAIIPYASDADMRVRCEIIVGLGTMGPAASPAVSVLSAALDDPDAVCTEDAAHALGKIGPSARAALPALRRLVEKNGSPAAKAAIKLIQSGC